MIFIYVMCILACLMIAFFVLWPLTKSNVMLSRTYDGFSDEDELRNVLEVRDALIQQLVSGTTEHAVVKQLTPESSFEALVNVCLRLQKAGLKFLPLLLITVLSYGFCPSYARAQQVVPANGDEPSPHAQPQFNMPESLITDGRHVSRLHQFSLSAGEHVLVVRYMAIFKNATPGQTIQVLLPFPAGARNLKITKQEDALLQSDDNKNPVVIINSAPSVVELSAEFTLEANDGRAAWRNNNHKTLPGTTLIMMSVQEGGVRNFLQTFVEMPNVWPARIINEPKDFNARTDLEEYDPREPNYAMLVKLPPQHLRKLIRMGDDNSTYPEFDVVGIVPTRTFIYSLTIGFGILIFASGLVMVARQKSGPSLD